MGLGILPIDGVEDSVIPAVLRHDMLLWGRTASCLAKARNIVSSDGNAGNCKGGFRGRDKRDKLGRVRPVVSYVVAGVVTAKPEYEDPDGKVDRAFAYNNLSEYHMDSGDELGLGTMKQGAKELAGT